MWPNPQETAEVVTFTEEILNGTLHFLCSGGFSEAYSEFSRTYKMELWLKTDKGFKSSNIFTKSTRRKSHHIVTISTVAMGGWIWCAVDVADNRVFKVKIIYFCSFYFFAFLSSFHLKYQGIFRTKSNIYDGDSFPNIVNNFPQWTIFAKTSAVVVWLGCRYASE